MARPDSEIQPYDLSSLLAVYPMYSWGQRVVRALLRGDAQSPEISLRDPPVFRGNVDDVLRHLSGIVSTRLVPESSR